MPEKHPAHGQYENVRREMRTWAVPFSCLPGKGVGEMGLDTAGQPQELAPQLGSLVNLPLASEVEKDLRSGKEVPQGDSLVCCG